MLATENLTVRLGKKTLLNRISLQLKPGELLALIGPNGAGKSTLLKSLCGELRPAAGQVRLNGKNVRQWSLLERAQLCGVLPQHSTLAFPFSVADVVAMGRSPHFRTANSGNDSTIVRQAMQVTGTDHLRDRNYITLSGGEKQRVHFARILAQIWESSSLGPRYMLLDEPTSALDPACQHDFLQIARHFCRQQETGVLAILHDLNLAALYADRIALLHAGRLVIADTPTHVLTQELIERIFGYPVAISDFPRNINRPLVIPLYP